MRFDPSALRRPQAQNERARSEYQGLRPEVTGQSRADYRSQRRSDEPLPGNRQCRAQRRLRNHQGCNRRPIRFRQPEHPRDQQRRNGRHRCPRGMHSYPATPGYKNQRYRPAPRPVSATW